MTATTKLSRKGQVTIPEAFRSSRHWNAGTELLVIDAVTIDTNVMVRLLTQDDAAQHN